MSPVVATNKETRSACHGCADGNFAHSTSTMEVNQQDNNEEECKQLEAKIEPLMQELKGITRYNGKGRYKRTTALERGRSKVKKELAKVWKELIVLKQESEQSQHKRWSFNEEIRNLI
ncbi:hypothetical protein Tco_1404146 [Tanacetum coccineum]